MNDDPLTDAIEQVNPARKVHRIASEEGLSPDIADDFLKVTGGIESGNRHYDANGKVRRSVQGAIGFSQITPGAGKDVGITNLEDENENIRAGLRYFNKGGTTPTARRVHYFGGPGGLSTYNRTGQLPRGTDALGTTYSRYMAATGADTSQRAEPTPQKGNIDPLAEALRQVRGAGAEQADVTAPDEQAAAPPQTIAAKFNRRVKPQPPTSLLELPATMNIGGRNVQTTEQPSEPQVGGFASVNLPRKRVGHAFGMRGAQEQAVQQATPTDDVDIMSRRAKFRQQVALEHKVKNAFGIPDLNPITLARNASKTPDQIVEDEAESRYQSDVDRSLERQRVQKILTPEDRDAMAQMADQLRSHGPGVARGTDVGVQQGVAGLEYKLAGLTEVGSKVSQIVGAGPSWIPDWFRRKALAGELAIEDVNRLDAPTREHIAQFLAESAVGLGEVMATPGGPITKFAALAGSEALGRNQSASDVLEATARGAETGAAFQGAEKLVRSGAGLLERVGTVAPATAAGTGIVELAHGATPREAGIAGLTNAAFAASGQFGRAPRRPGGGGELGEVAGRSVIPGFEAEAQLRADREAQVRPPLNPREAANQLRAAELRRAGLDVVSEPGQKPKIRPTREQLENAGVRRPTTPPDILNEIVNDVRSKLSRRTTTRAAAEEPQPTVPTGEPTEPVVGVAPKPTTTPPEQKPPHHIEDQNRRVRNTQYGSAGRLKPGFREPPPTVERVEHEGYLYSKGEDGRWRGGPKGTMVTNTSTIQALEFNLTGEQPAEQQRGPKLTQEGNKWIVTQQGKNGPIRHEFNNQETAQDAMDIIGRGETPVTNLVTGKVMPKPGGKKGGFINVSEIDDAMDELRKQYPMRDDEDLRALLEKQRPYLFAPGVGRAEERELMARDAYNESKNRRASKLDADEQEYVRRVSSLRKDFPQMSPDEARRQIAAGDPKLMQRLEGDTGIQELGDVEAPRAEQSQPGRLAEAFARQRMNEFEETAPSLTKPTQVIGRKINEDAERNVPYAVDAKLSDASIGAIDLTGQDIDAGTRQELRQGIGGSELGQGIYATSDPESAAGYARGQSPLDRFITGGTPRHEGEVLPVSVPKGSKIFEQREYEDKSAPVYDDVHNAMMKLSRTYAREWRENFGEDVEPTGANIWDNAQDTGSLRALQKVLRDQDYVGASHPVTGGHTDYSIWKPGAIRKGHVEGDINLYRGQREIRGRVKPDERLRSKRDDTYDERGYLHVGIDRDGGFSVLRRLGSGMDEKVKTGFKSWQEAEDWADASGQRRAPVPEEPRGPKAPKSLDEMSADELRAEVKRTNRGDWRQNRDARNALVKRLADDKEAARAAKLEAVEIPEATMQRALADVKARRSYGRRTVTPQNKSWRLSWSNGSREWWAHADPSPANKPVDIDANEIMVEAPTRKVADAIAHRLTTGKQEHPLGALSTESLEKASRSKSDARNLIDKLRGEDVLDESAENLGDVDAGPKDKGNKGGGEPPTDLRLKKPLAGRTLQDYPPEARYRDPATGRELGDKEEPWEAEMRHLGRGKFELRGHSRYDPHNRVLYVDSLLGDLVGPKNAQGWARQTTPAIGPNGEVETRAFVYQRALNDLTDVMARAHYRLADWVREREYKEARGHFLADELSTKDWKARWESDLKDYAANYRKALDDFYNHVGVPTIAVPHTVIRWFDTALDIADTNTHEAIHAVDPMVGYYLPHPQDVGPNFAEWMRTATNEGLSNITNYGNSPTKVAHVATETLAYGFNGDFELQHRPQLIGAMADIIERTVQHFGDKSVREIINRVSNHGQELLQEVFDFIANKRAQTGTGNISLQERGQEGAGEGAGEAGAKEVGEPPTQKKETGALDLSEVAAGLRAAGVRVQEAYAKIAGHQARRLGLDKVNDDVAHNYFAALNRYVDSSEAKSPADADALKMAEDAYAKGDFAKATLLSERALSGTHDYLNRLNTAAIGVGLHQMGVDVPAEKASWVKTFAEVKHRAAEFARVNLSDETGAITMRSKKVLTENDLRTKKVDEERLSWVIEPMVEKLWMSAAQRIQNKQLKVQDIRGYVRTEVAGMLKYEDAFAGWHKANKSAALAIAARRVSELAGNMPQGNAALVAKPEDKRAIWRKNVDKWMALENLPAEKILDMAAEKHGELFGRDPEAAVDKLYQSILPKARSKTAETWREEIMNRLNAEETKLDVEAQKVAEPTPAEQAAALKGGAPVAAAQPETRERQLYKSLEESGREAGTEKSYTPESMEQWKASAEKIISEFGIEGAQEFYDKSKPSAVRVAVGQALGDHYQIAAISTGNEKYWEKARMLANERVLGATEAGRTVAAFNMLNRFTLSGSLDEATRLYRQATKQPNASLPNDLTKSVTQKAIRIKEAKAKVDELTAQVKSEPEQPKISVRKPKLIKKSDRGEVGAVGIKNTPEYIAAATRKKDAAKNFKAMEKKVGKYWTKASHPALEAARIELRDATYDMMKLYTALQRRSNLGVLGWARRSFNLTRSFMVSAFPTAARNAQTQIERSALERVTDAIELTLRHGTGLDSDLQYSDIAKNLTRIWDKDSWRYSEQILKEHPEQFTKMFATYAGGVDIPMPNKIAHGLDRIFGSLENAAYHFNFFNRAQEFHIRSAEFLAELELHTKKKTGMSLEEFVGRVGADKLPKDLIEQAVNKALDVTFANNPPKDTEVGKFMNQLIDIGNALPPTMSPAAFPRWIYNSWKFLYQYNPIGGAIDVGVQAYKGGNVPRAVARWAAGTAMMTLAYQIRKSDMAGGKWYQLKVGDNTFDMRPFGPFSTYLFMAEGMRRYLNHERGFSFNEFAGALGASTAPGGLSISTAERLYGYYEKGDWDQFSKMLKKEGGDVGRALLTPIHQFKDLIAAFDKSQNVVNETDEMPLLGPVLESIPYASKAAGLKPAYRSTSGEPIHQEDVKVGGVRVPGSAVKFFTGYRAEQQQNYIAKEIDRLHVRPSEIRTYTGDATIDREINERMGAILDSKADALRNNSDYQQADDKLKFAQLRGVLRQAEGQAKAEVYPKHLDEVRRIKARKRPYWQQQLAPQP